MKSLWKYHKYFAMYCAMLLIALIIFYALPKYPGFTLDPEFEPFALHDLAIRDNLEKARWAPVLESWEFNSAETSITVTTTGDYLNTLIVVSENGTENIIAVTEYAANPVIAGRIPSHSISLRGNRLRIDSPSEVNVKLYAFSGGILGQFRTADSLDELHQFRDIFSDWTVLYIQVPKGMELRTDDYSFINLIFTSDY